MMTSLLWGYIVTVLLLTITPGLDTAFILRTSLSQGGKQAFLAALGINLGLLCWGMLVAVGLGSLLMASALAFSIIKYAGACYLGWLGIRMLLKPRKSFRVDSKSAPVKASGWHWMLSGLMTNLLNPKIGIFYVSFLPQFVPSGSNFPFYALFLACIHVVLGILWCGGLILMTRPFARHLQSGNVVRWMDRITGGVFLAFAARLAVSRA